MWELNHKEGWAPKNWCFPTVISWRRLLRVSWTAMRLNQSILKEISPEYSLEELMLELKLQYFGHLMQRADPDAEKDWRKEEKRSAEDEMVGWHHWLHTHEFEQAPGNSEGQGSLACCNSRDCKEVDPSWPPNKKAPKGSGFLPLEGAVGSHFPPSTVPPGDPEKHSAFFS